MLSKYCPSAVQDSELLDCILRWIERLVNGCWRSIRVSVSTICRGSDVWGSKTGMQWGVELLSQAAQIPAFASINKEDGEGNEEKYSKPHSNANDCTLSETTLVGSLRS